jgi:biotin synthase
MSSPQSSHPLRHDWSLDEVVALFDQPFMDLIFRAQLAHRACFDPNKVQVSTLLSIKTGACPEDCGYCAQSAAMARTWSPSASCPWRR